MLLRGEPAACEGGNEDHVSGGAPRGSATKPILLKARPAFLRLTPSSARSYWPAQAKARRRFSRAASSCGSSCKALSKSTIAALASRRRRSEKPLLLSRIAYPPFIPSDRP